MLHLPSRSGGGRGVDGSVARKRLWGGVALLRCPQLACRSGTSMSRMPISGCAITPPSDAASPQAVTIDDHDAHYCAYPMSASDGPDAAARVVAMPGGLGRRRRPVEAGVRWSPARLHFRSPRTADCPDYAALPRARCPPAAQRDAVACIRTVRRRNNGMSMSRRYVRCCLRIPRWRCRRARRRAGRLHVAGDHGHRAEPDRRRRRRGPAATDAAPAAPRRGRRDPLQGTLPIVTDQFATVTVVPSEELQRSPGSTLGDVLFAKPGITGSSFAPGASSRPIVRGLDVNRVGIVDNGIGGGGVSDLGEDHFVPVDPLATEPGRGDPRPGDVALRLAVDRRRRGLDQQPDPDALPCSPFAAAGYARAAAASHRLRKFEMRGALSSVDNGREGGVLLDAGAGNFAVPRRCLRPPHRRLSRAELSLSGRARSGRAAVRDAARRLQRPPAELVDALERGVGRRLLSFPRRLCRRRRTRRTTTSTPFPGPTAKDTAPASTRARTR